jgi:DNA-binding LacI/PurR family transcriptional regulator
VTERAAQRWVGIYTAFDILLPRTSFFHTQVPRLLRAFLHARGAQAEVYMGTTETDTSEQYPSNRRFLADVTAGRLDGVAVVSAPFTSGWQDWVRDLPLPAVGVHTPYHVDARYAEFVRQGVARLHEAGCRRLAMLAWGVDGLREPFEAAMTKVGLPVHPRWVRHDLHPMLSGAGWEEFREAWAAEREKPDGLLVADDVLFDEAQIAILELGIRVPDQLRIVTHANKGDGKRYPFPVTLLQMDPVRYAEILGEMLLKRMRGEDVIPPTAEIPCELVEAAPVARPVAREIAPHEAVLQEGER